MTINESIENLKMILEEATEDEHSVCYVTNCDKEPLEMAIEALEKQIPKKPNKAIDSSWGIKKEVHVCPVCDYYLTEVHFLTCDEASSTEKVTFCETCGQAIDWNE